MALVRTAGALVLVVGMAAPATAQSITGLGFLPGDDYSEAFSVSHDGTVVVGWGAWYGFRWTAGGGMATLPQLPTGTWSDAWATSGDGTVTVGRGDSIGGNRAIRWTAAGPVDLGTIPEGYDSMATAVSADGSVVTGRGRNGNFVRRAIRWTEAGGMQDLGTLPGDTSSSAWGISADGSTIVGRSESATGFYRAMRWTAGGGMQPVGLLPGGVESQATAASSDGSVIAGVIYNMPTNTAFRWTSAGGLQNLGLAPGGANSMAFGVNADGSVVVGVDSTLWRALLWNPTVGMVDLNAYLPTLGINLDGWTLRFARTVTPDGRFIVGWGDHNGLAEAYLVQIPAYCYADCNGDQLLNLADFGCFQTKFALGNIYADCNGDGVLNLADFGCFQTKFALACP